MKLKSQSTLCRMNYDWKWPEGFTPLTGSRSMVNLNELETDTRVDVVTRSESTTALVDMRPVQSSSSSISEDGDDQVKQTCPKMSSTYYQCRAGRDASFRDKAVEIANTAELGHVVGGEVSRVGSFDSERGLLEMCFVGSRVLRGTEVTNQNISLSFDPSIMTCITCPKEHSVFRGGKAVCVCVADQNFVSNLAGANNCVSVVRMEGGGLVELTDLVVELFESQKFPPGSVICIGSASHLHKVGLTVYTMDWNRCIDILTRRITGIQICPLVPIIKDDIPGSLATDLISLVSWLAKQYEGSTLGLVSVWALLAGTISTITTEELQSPTYHAVALPTTLAVGSPLTTHRFRSTSSRRVTSKGCDAKATDGLLSALLTALSKDLGIDCHPGEILVREPIQEQGQNDKINHIILVGSSHMRRVEQFLQDEGYNVRTISLRGGLPTIGAIEELSEQLTGLGAAPGAAVVFDVLGNFTYRYEQEDGGMSLPVPIQGGHHLLGKVGVCTDVMLKSLISKLIPVFGLNSNLPCVVLPAIPRYIAGGCCMDMSHAYKAGTPGEAQNLVEQIVHLRKLLRTELTASSLKGFWVPDVVEDLAAPLPGGAGSITAKVEVLKGLFTPDCVHLTNLGYTRLARCIIESVNTAAKKKSDAADCTIAGVKQSFYWRGFCSVRGGTRSAHSATSYKARAGQSGARGGSSSGSSSGGFHPYRGRGGGRGRGFRH